MYCDKNEKTNRKKVLQHDDNKEGVSMKEENTHTHTHTHTTHENNVVARKKE